MQPRDTCRHSSNARFRLGVTNQRAAIEILQPHPAREVDEDVEVRARLSRRLDRFPKQRAAPLRVGHAAGFFSPHRRRKNHVGELRRLRVGEAILDDEKHAVERA
jgi:hypothetical protein